MSECSCIRWSKSEAELSRNKETCAGVLICSRLSGDVLVERGVCPPGRGRRFTRRLDSMWGRGNFDFRSQAVVPQEHGIMK